jgi:protein-S-isoprenylcysteine O-methyltransferase Ste14
MAASVLPPKDCVMLKKQMEMQGQLLFRWRSYIPLLFIPLVLVALKDSGLIGRLVNESWDACWEVLCLMVSFVGLAIRGLTVGYVPKKTSGRNTKQQRAAVLNTMGMYSIVRHPLYLGNFLIFLGMLLFVQVLWLGVIGVLAFWLYYERIIFAEEAFLEAKFGAGYLEWTEKTPVFFPRLENWVSADLPFSLKNVLKREYTGFFVIITAFTVLDIGEDFWGEGALQIDEGWITLFILGGLVYLTLLTMKRKTRLLDVEGR